MSISTASSPSLLETLVNHVALPPRLPGKLEQKIDQFEHALIDGVLDASRTLRDLTAKDVKTNDLSQSWETVRHILQTCKNINAGGKLNKASLGAEFRNLDEKNVLILHVTQQNAGLIIRKYHGAQDQMVSFEAFEASPSSEQVLAAETALQWDFPGSAIAIPYTEFTDQSFQEHLASFLEQASTESIKRFAEKATKGGSMAHESRGTTDPALITQMLMTLLEVNGHRIYPPLLRKRVRDDVCWTDGAEKPWRRSPFWLVLRVSLERHLRRVLGNEPGRTHYKFLICLVLSRLMEDSIPYLEPEMLALLRAKLARRLSKLEVARERASPSMQSVYETLFTLVRPIMNRSIQTVNAHIIAVWNDFKQSTQRPVNFIPRRAGSKNLTLKLQNSTSHLQNVLSWQHRIDNQSQPKVPHLYPIQFDASAAAPYQFRSFASRYFCLSKLETDLQSKDSQLTGSVHDNEELCIQLARDIDDYLATVGDAYENNPDQKGIMLLVVMGLWMLMDQCATKLFPLLLDYNPAIPPELLDVLRLPFTSDLVRLKRIQDHLKERHTRSKLSRMTIFNEPAKDCFGARYYDESQDSARLQQLHEDIETAAETARTKKEKQWKELYSRFESLEKRIAESTCIITYDGLEEDHDRKRCTKCFLQREARRVKITVHEHPLPHSATHGKVVVFELGCPEAFVAYRNSTWRILATLGRQQQIEAPQPWTTLCEYSELRKFSIFKGVGVSLASTTKSHLASHYSSVGFPVELDQVCLPHRLKWGYFDSTFKIWPGRSTQKLSFAHHFQITLPAKSPFSALNFTPGFFVPEADSNGPSSSEVIASQTKCPSGLSVHEFMTYQTCCSGKSRRWPMILMELGSSNLNFSTEAVTLLMNQLASQAGPAHESNPLRMIHRIFLDESFCKRLIEQIGQRLDNVASNWRETNCVDMLITFILKLCSAAPRSVITQASQLLERVRTITFKWIGQLRAEIHGAIDASTSRRCSRYAFWAALLCRRTFVGYAGVRGAAAVPDMDSAALCCFIECSITLQDNLDSDPAALRSPLKNALIRDLKMVHQMRSVLQRSLRAHPGSLESAINNIWPLSEGSMSRSYSKLEFLTQPSDSWVQLIVAGTTYTKQQAIHYHLLEGLLLVDGQPLGKLPAKHRESLVLERLFGKQNLLTFPSNLRGMTYRVAFKMKCHEVHIGFRNNGLIVQARVRGSILEFIPSEIFRSESKYDLPADLVDNCIHWLNLETGVLEIRQEPDIWTSKLSNWCLDFHRRIARRRNVTLVDPYSQLFRRVVALFHRFELPDRLTVYQPEKGPLFVELRRMELTFLVNSKNLLYCKQLRAEIDPNQDAGTWYGLNSKLILRDIANSRQRSIIIPLDKLRYTRREVHVAVNIPENSGTYSRFIINDVLGRLECAPEPKLLYLKAQLHAYTSFVVPDSLTGRTGTEEALHCLRSGYCQPWAPLNQGALHTLANIAHLTPRREYYPRDMKTMQQVTWDPYLTTFIQNDEFRPVVEAIYRKSNMLSTFSLTSPKPSSLPFTVGPDHLLRRSRRRLRLHQRLDSRPGELCDIEDLLYAARDRHKQNQAYANVYESVSYIRGRNTNLPTTSDLAGILQSWPIIGGFDRRFDRFLLSDRLEVQLPLEMGALAHLCCHSRTEDMYQLMYLFAAMSFHNDAQMEVIQTLIAFAVLEDLNLLELPECPSYTHFRHGHNPSVDTLMQLIRPHCVMYPGDERSTFNYRLNPKLRRKLEAAELEHERQAEKDCKILALFLLEQWPCLEPSIRGLGDTLLVEISQAMEIIRPEWTRLYHNLELSSFIDKVQKVLNAHHAENVVEIPRIQAQEQEVYWTGYHHGEIPTLSQTLLRRPGPSPPGGLAPVISNRGPQWNSQASLQSPRIVTQKENLSTFGKPVQAKQRSKTVPREIQELQQIIGDTIQSASTVRKEYGRDMQQSLEALKLLNSTPFQDEVKINPMMLAAEISKSQNLVRWWFSQLCNAFEKTDSRAQWLKDAGLWPCITPVTLLEQLRSTCPLVFGSGMKESFIEYGSCITALQRLLRIEDAHKISNRQRLHEELINPGYTNWRPSKHPDWLLLEIEANILIRPDQVDVATATIKPNSGSNSVLQMNMGQGKTSCIMPMVAAVLADTKKLLRVVVPKALLLQTAQIMQSRLGGLLGREIRHIPFSRKTSTNENTIKAYCTIQRETRASSGVMLTLPEHVLSFMLSGLQRLSDGRIPEATQMINVQSWLNKVSRDVLDESDFTLAVRTQLIYPSGSQSTVDGHPHRWETAEVLLRLVESHLWNLQHEFPRSIEVVRRPLGGFPVVFFLRKDVEDTLVARLVKDIIRGQTSIVPARECTQADRLAIKLYITEATVAPAVAGRIREIFPDNPAARQNIHLLRGLLVHRILLLTLKKRWNVQYGLHPDRDPVAVPFQFKGVPSEQSEWGHPDVCILLTALAFYFGGLQYAQLRQCLEHLNKLDDPSGEYDRWTCSSDSLPSALCEWNVINVDDEAQLMEIWQHLRYKVEVIDYFLNHFVFPRHAKQFRTKLQASGWDIPLFTIGSQSPAEQQSTGKGVQPLTTGFSGTNDNKTMLPLTIKQADLPALAHTNTEVLTYLLQPRSREYVLAADQGGKRLSEIDLLARLREMRIRMLIDAGAQILEMDNLSLVKAWLKIDHEAPAAVYFDTENKPFVIYRHGSKVPLAASPYIDNLGECLVYLDEAHTRGTDLKMPADARGALTLGLGLSKDQSVQAAMRLRQLGTTQSVVFFAPPEVHQSILDLRKKRHGDAIDSYDVICWLLEQTCHGIEQLQPLYFSQGVDFCTRTEAASHNPDMLVDSDQRESYLKILRQNERQTIEQLYAPKSRAKPSRALGPLFPRIAAFMKELNTRRKGFQDTGGAVHGSALQEVEQEREVAYEVEAVREVQRPVHYVPLSFSGLHRDILGFAETGRLSTGSAGYEHAFIALRRTALGIKYGISPEATTSNLFMSTEFMRTVSTPLGRPDDNFIRQVNWILWSTVTETALIIIPEEAERLISIIRDARQHPTHLLTYAAPVTRKMLHFNNLGYYAVPALTPNWQPPKWLKIELGIIAGRLYFEWEEYEDLLAYLGLRKDSVEPPKTPKTLKEPFSPTSFTVDGPAESALEEVDLDGCVRQDQSFTAKPLTFLQEWLAVRRKGQDFTHTPMGYVCQGKPLAANHPFFGRAENDGAAKAAAANAGQGKHWKANGTSEDDGASGEEFNEEEGYFDMDEYEGEGDTGLFDDQDLSSDDSFVDADTEFGGEAYG